MTLEVGTGTVAEVLAARRRRRLVGRKAETELFRATLDADPDVPQVLYVHGPGGVGKSSLLQVLAGVAVDRGAVVALLDGATVEPSPMAVQEALRPWLDAVCPGRGWPAGRPVLLLDTYEQLAHVDRWVRERLLPSLPASTVVVVAGRDAPAAGWRDDLGWDDVLRVVALRNLDADDSREYLRATGVPPDLHEQALSATYGHPLALALLCDVLAAGAGPVPDPLPPDLVQILLRRFVNVVPGPAHRRGLEVLAVSRTTDEPLLRTVMDPEEAHKVLGWLRSLSFVRLGDGGVAPHDLARQVLDADLRWRDSDGYADIFRTVRGHALAKVRASSGRQQQRALFDLKFLFRQVRGVLSPVDWGSWGERYPEPMTHADVDQVVELVRRHEGDESAVAAARWVRAQPGGFSVLRDESGAVTGVVAIVDLTAADAVLVRDDPGAAAAWDFVQRNAPPRPGEVVTQCRFVVDRLAHQGPSATLNAVPVLTLQHQLCTADLAWDLLTMVEPDKWNDYFAAADMQRAARADFVVGGRRYGLFAHDFRVTPVEEWTELWSERALAQDPTLPPRHEADAVLVLSSSDFRAAVRQAMRDLHDPRALAGNPLLRTRLVMRRADPGEEVEALTGLLLEAIAEADRVPRTEHLHRVLQATFVHPAGTQEGAAARLGLPFSTYRRHLVKGEDLIVDRLWQEELHGS